MTQEEKAKRFDEVLAMAKDCITYIHDDAVNQYMLDMFPELKESEGEKIRKVLIGWINLEPSTSFNDTFDGFSKEQILAWLEKQGQTFTKKDVDDAYLKGVCDTKHELEKHGEQKSFDYENANIQQKDFAPKVEPKFKVGDWVVTSYGMVNQVIAVDEDGDGFTLDDDTYLSGFWKDNFHLWTIQDAKDGDVLAAHECLVLFREIDGLNIRCYCTYHFMNNPSFYVDTLQNKDAFHPATKEQRDLLFRKVKETGYECLLMKKELKEIQQNPAWNEEDSLQLNEAIEAVKESSYSSKRKDVVIDWLKSIKDRVGCEVNCTTTKAWNEEDEAHFDSIIKRLEEMCKPLSPFAVTRCSINGDKNWLKSLKGRYTWKPSDEQIDTLKEATNIAGGKYKSCLNSLYQDLMKLKG